MVIQSEIIRMSVKRPSRKAKSGDVFGQRRTNAKMLRAGLYARVSTNDQQTLPMQLRAPREYAARRGWAVTLQVREISSGAVGEKHASNLSRPRAAAKLMSCGVAPGLLGPFGNGPARHA